MASLQQIAAFGQANPQNPGGGLTIGQRAAEMRNQNRLAELARQDAQEQQEYARQRLQQQEQHDFARKATESMLSAPLEQRPQMYQGFLQEAPRRSQRGTVGSHGVQDRGNLRSAESAPATRW